MTTSDQQWTVQPGTDVYGSDGNKIGSVDDIQDGNLVIHKGFFFPKDHYIPFSAIASHSDDRIDLNISSEQAKNEDWGDQSAGTTTTTSYDDTGRTGYDTTPLSTSTNAYDTSVPASGSTDYDTTTTTTTTTDYDNTRSNDTDRISVPVVEEELTATKHNVERGAVRVQTNVTEREETLSVPVTEERVHVERRSVNRDATAADMSNESGTLEVPLYGEEVDMNKRARVVEEVEISKEAVQENRQVSGTVRRDDVEVVETNVSDANARTTGTSTTETQTTDSNRRRR